MQTTVLQLLPTWISFFPLRKEYLFLHYTFDNSAHYIPTCIFVHKLPFSLHPQNTHVALCTLLTRLLAVMLRQQPRWPSAASRTRSTHAARRHLFEKDTIQTYLRVNSKWDKNGKWNEEKSTADLTEKNRTRRKVSLNLAPKPNNLWFARTHIIYSFRCTL